MKEFDIIIAGGGMVGSTAALALAQLDLKIALIESVEPELETSPSFDQRAVALSAASVEIFKGLDLWPTIKPFAESINHIHISDKGHFGFARLDAADYPVEALGQVIPLDQTGPVLWQAIREQKNIETFCPCRLIEIDSETNSPDSGSIEIKIINDLEEVQTLTTKLLLGADGTFSTVAKLADIKSERDDYQQHAIIANISTEKNHENKAFERFTESGPLALLPLTRNRMSLVWCNTPESANRLLGLDEQRFTEALQDEFGYRLGRIRKVGERHSYPLALHVAHKPYRQRVLLLGNSAHTLHPIAGQGFNIGLRDVAALRDAVEESISLQDFDLGSSAFLESYQVSRKPDWRRTILATDSLVRIFSQDFFPLVVARDKALNLFDKIPFFKRRMAYTAMGFAGESAKLTRGLKASD